MHHWRDRLLFAWCVILITAAWTAIYPGWDRVAAWLGKDVAPAWVQGIGSIAGIFTAIWVAHAQHQQSLRLALELEERRAKRRHNAVLGIALYAQREIKRAGATAKKAASGQMERQGNELEMLDYAEAELASINLSELDSYYMGAGVRRMLSCARAMRDLYKAAFGYAGASGHVRARQLRQIDEVVTATDDSFKDISEKAAQELAEDPRIVLPW